uniref:Uncharacterized protein n=1 Tax=Heliothis virescens TaxID=7102 RepID=A0A2A4JR66_HELVI
MHPRLSHYSWSKLSWLQKCQQGAAASGIVVARIVLTGPSLAETGRRAACVQFTQQRLHAGSRALR